MNILRRRLVLAGGALVATGYSTNRGLRYPPLSLEPAALASTVTMPDARLVLHDLILNEHDNCLRAIAPEPSLGLSLQKGQHKFTVVNLGSNTALRIEGGKGVTVHEEQQGLRRFLRLDARQACALQLHWSLPKQHAFTFAVIGDTGGGEELAWVLKRAHDLNAQFLLHLGDFNYLEGEYEAAIQKFKQSRLPVYVSIGNHDFHDNWLVYHRFRAEIGPMNHAFTVAGTQFINIDTAADFFPAGAGLRGKLFAQLRADQTAYVDRIFFGHRPLKDPRPHDDHIIGGVGEVDWLSNEVSALGGRHFLTGHVHHSAELEVNRIKQWTAGEGLGHENIVAQKQVAKLLMGEVAPGQRARFKWVDLNLPWRSHSSQTHRIKLVRDNRLRQLDWHQKMMIRKT